VAKKTKTEVREWLRTRSSYPTPIFTRENQIARAACARWGHKWSNDLIAVTGAVWSEDKHIVGVDVMPGFARTRCTRPGCGTYLIVRVPFTAEEAQ
jgi:hypothetical protein